MNIINDNLSVTSVSATTYYNLPTEEVVVYVVNNIILPQQTIYNTQVIQQPHQRVEYINNYIQPAPRVIDISNNNIYLRICGEITSNSKNVGCRRCIDEWIINNPDKLGPMDLTRNNTKCK